MLGYIVVEVFDRDGLMNAVCDEDRWLFSGLMLFVTQLAPNKSPELKSSAELMPMSLKASRNGTRASGV